MTTHIETSATVNAPVEKVFAALSDRAYWEYDAQHLSDEPGEVNAFSADPSVEVTMFEVLPTDALPEAVRSMVSQNLKLKRVISFGPLTDGVSNGEMTAEIKGAPVKFTAELTLVGDDAGTTTIEAEADIDVTIPMIGAVIEPKVADAVKDILVNEAALIDKWLSENA